MQMRDRAKNQLADQKLRGLFLDNGSEGATYCYRFTDGLGREHVLRLGPADLLSVSDATRMAKHYGRKILMWEVEQVREGRPSNGNVRPSSGYRRVSDRHASDRHASDHHAQAGMEDGVADGFEADAGMDEAMDESEPVGAAAASVTSVMPVDPPFGSFAPHTQPEASLDPGSAIIAADRHTDGALVPDEAPISAQDPPPPLQEPSPPLQEPSLTFAQFVAERYAPHAKMTKRGYVTEESILKNHLLPALGNRPLVQITKAELITFIHGKLTSLKPGTINRIINGLKVIFSRALEWEVQGIVKDPTKGIKQFANNSRHERYLSQEEAAKLLNAVLHSHNRMLSPIVAALLLTGCRKREILDARWEHVDLERGVLLVPISKSGKPRQVILSEPVKQIFLQAKAILVAHKGQEASDRYPWVFPNPDTGKPFSGVYKSWHAARCAVGLQDLRMHDLRHSFASALVNKGNSLYDVQKLLGHSSSRMTERYAHLSSERLTTVATEVSQHYQIP